MQANQQPNVATLHQRLQQVASVISGQFIGKDEIILKIPEAK